MALLARRRVSALALKTSSNANKRTRQAPSISAARCGNIK